MSRFKELRSVELSSFTITNTSIAVLFSIITAIIISVGIIAINPYASDVIIYIIPTLIAGTFMYGIYSSFCQGLLYNLLAKKLKTIAVELDGDEIVKISTSETAMMISSIITIQAVLIYLASMLILPLIMVTATEILLNSGYQTVAFSMYQILAIVSQPVTVVIFIFSTFIISFVFVLLGTYIYNILAKNGRGVVLKLNDENGLTAIDSFDPLKIAIVFAIIGGILNLILAAIMLISGGEVIDAVANVLGGFVGGFIEFYLFAIFYNFLVSKTGKVKIELIDFKIN